MATALVRTGHRGLDEALPVSEAALANTALFPCDDDGPKQDRTSLRCLKRYVSPFQHDKITEDYIDDGRFDPAFFRGCE